MTVNVTLRTPKGSPLTTAEVDANFADLAAAINAVGSGGGGSSYTLPAATTTVLGGVKVGSGLSIDGGGVMSLNLTSAAVTAALGFTPSNGSTGVTAFNSRTGAVSLTSGDVTSALGFTPMSAAAGSPHGSQQYIAAGTFTFVVPAGVTTVFLTGAAGGGGAYARVVVAQAKAPGGRGQVRYRTAVTVTPGETVTVTVGSAGASVSDNRVHNVYAGDGQNTTFGGYMVLIGGGGASGSSSNAVTSGSNQLPVNNLAFFMGNGSYPNQTFYGDPAVYVDDGSGGVELSPAAQPGYLIVEW